MKYVKPLKPYEVFMANVEAENPKQLIIKDLVESYSLVIGQCEITASFVPYPRLRISMISLGIMCWIEHFGCALAPGKVI